MKVLGVQRVEDLIRVVSEIFKMIKTMNKKRYTQVELANLKSKKTLIDLNSLKRSQQKLRGLILLNKLTIYITN